MGGSKKQTVGYWYKWLMHFGWCRGPVDAVLELRGGGATMWSGRLTQSGRITIDKPELWGGESAQGGVQGDWDILFGEPTQQPNDYLTATLGGTPPADTPGGDLSFKDLIELLFARHGIPGEGTPDATLRGQSAHRGKLTTVARGGRFGANIPNPKPVAIKVERILADWQDDTPWYPEKAVISAIGGQVLPLDSDGWEYIVLPPHMDPGHTNLTPPSSGWLSGQAPFGANVELSYNTEWPVDTVLWARRTVTIPFGSPQSLRVQAENGCVVFVNGQQIGAVNQDNLSIPGNQGNVFEFPLSAGQTFDLLIKAYDETDGTAPAGGTYLAVSTYSTGLNAMNPAHMLYDSIVYEELQGEPASMISDASFRAAADRLYNEGLGLCTTWDSASETPEQYQQRLCNLIGGCLNQSRVDGLYYLDLIRAPDDLNALPIISEDDVIAFKQTPGVIAEAPNLMRVEWFDPTTKEVRTTAPIYAAGAIQSAGAIIPDSRKFHEVPTEGLALRLGKRDLDAGCTPGATFDLTVLPRFRGLRPGTNARLQLPSEGIADLVVTVVKVDQGTARDSKMQLSVIQNIFSMPDAVYVDPDPPVWMPPSTGPRAPSAQVAFEAPYVELVSAMSAADLQALSTDAGFLAAAAVRPVSGVSFELDTAVDGATYDAAGSGDWCGTAVIAATAGPLDTAFAFTFGQDLDRVDVGSWASWDGEIVRVDALDTGAGTLTLGRGCADTVPIAHAAGSRIYFCGDWLAADPKEYAGGETVHAKLLTRTTVGKLALANATALDVVMDERAYRPYPPGHLLVNGQPYPELIAGDLQLAWSHRDRLLQADQLVDTTSGDVGPEAGTTYTLRLYNEIDALVRTENIDGNSYEWLAADEQTDSGLAAEAGPWLPSMLSVPPRILLNDLSPAVDDGTGKCSTLGDLSGNGNDFQQTTATQRPTLVAGGLNGRRVLGFSGGQRMIGPATAGGMRNVAGGFVFGVYKLDPADTSNTYRAIMEIDTPSSTFVRMGLFAGTSSAKNRAAIAGRRLDGDSFNTATSATERGGVWVMALGVLDYTARTLTLHVNGAQDQQLTNAWTGAGNSSDSDSHATTLGSDSASTTHAFRGQMAEVIERGGMPPTQDEIDRLFGYAAWRWGLQANLPAGHPYRDAPPLDGSADASGHRLNGRIRFELESTRDGLASSQHHDVEVRRSGYGFNYGMYYGGT